MKLLVKEIVSKSGAVHFRRYRLLELPWFRIYVHQILKADEDAHEHDHPWSFLSLILKGGYIEQSEGKLKTRTNLKNPVAFSDRYRPHKLHTILRPTWTLVFGLGKRGEWGYDLNPGWADHKTYRTMKNEGKL